MNKPVRQPLDEKIYARISREPNGCWMWRGGVDRDGYPIIQHGAGNQVRPARVAWELSRGKPVPADVRLLRGCGEKLCINPDHARPVKAPRRTRKAA